MDRPQCKGWEGKPICLSRVRENASGSWAKSGRCQPCQRQHLNGLDIPRRCNNFLVCGSNANSHKRVCSPCEHNMARGNPIAPRKRRYLGPSDREYSTCIRCRQESPRSDFFPRGRILSPACKGCLRSYAHHFTLDMEVCLIDVLGAVRCYFPGCAATSNLCIDHDRSCCNKSSSCGMCIRGWLCKGHNMYEGQYRTLPLNERKDPVLNLYLRNPPMKEVYEKLGLPSLWTGGQNQSSRAA